MEITRREFNKFTIATVALGPSLAGGAGTEARPVKRMRVPGMDGMYERIREVEQKFARGEATVRDMANYYVCRFNIYANRGLFDGPEGERAYYKALESLRALDKVWPRT